MAQVLKRKRGAQQKDDIEQLKRAKSATETLEREQDGKAGWDKLFAPLNKSLDSQIAVLNGNGNDVEQNSEGEGKLGKKGKKSKKGTKKQEWRVGAPFGGRMIDVDPVFTEDEK